MTPHLNALKSTLVTGQWDIEDLKAYEYEEGSVVFEVLLFPASWGRPVDPFTSMTIRVKQGHIKWFLSESGLEWSYAITVFDGIDNNGKALRQVHLTDI